MSCSIARRAVSGGTSLPAFQQLCPTPGLAPAFAPHPALRASHHMCANAHSEASRQRRRSLLAAVARACRRRRTRSFAIGPAPTRPLPRNVGCCSAWAQVQYDYVMISLELKSLVTVGGDIFVRAPSKHPSAHTRRNCRQRKHARSSAPHPASPRPPRHTQRCVPPPIRLLPVRRLRSRSRHS